MRVDLLCVCVLPFYVRKHKHSDFHLWCVCYSFMCGYTNRAISVSRSFVTVRSTVTVLCAMIQNLTIPNIPLKLRRRYPHIFRPVRWLLFRYFPALPALHRATSTSQSIAALSNGRNKTSLYYLLDHFQIAKFTTHKHKYESITTASLMHLRLHCRNWKMLVLRATVCHQGVSSALRVPQFCWVSPGPLSLTEMGNYVVPGRTKHTVLPRIIIITLVSYRFTCGKINIHVKPFQGPQANRNQFAFTVLCAVVSTTMLFRFMCG